MVNKKQNKNFWIILSVLICIALIFVIGYGIKLYLNNTYYNYNTKNGEYKMGASKVGDVVFYHITVADDLNKQYTYSFRNHPKDLEDIYLEPSIVSQLNRPEGIRKLYVTQDPELANMTETDSVLGIVSFEQILTGNFGMYNLDLSNVYTVNYLNYITPVTCANVNDTTAVIYVKVGDETKIYSDNGCIIIEGRGGSGVLRASEKFAYSLLGVF